MVKGISRRVIVVDSPDPKLFEQAIFIVRNDAFSQEGVTSQQVLGEACRIARSCAAGRAPAPVAAGAPLGLGRRTGGGGRRPDGLAFVVRGESPEVRTSGDFLYGSR